MGRLDDIQTTLKPLIKNRKNLKLICMTILGLAESFKVINRPDPNRPGPTEPDPIVTLFESVFLKKV